MTGADRVENKKKPPFFLHNDFIMYIQHVFSSHHCASFVCCPAGTLTPTSPVLPQFASTLMTWWVPNQWAVMCVCVKERERERKHEIIGPAERDRKTDWLNPWTLRDKNKQCLLPPADLFSIFLQIIFGTCLLVALAVVPLSFFLAASDQNQIIYIIHTFLNLVFDYQFLKLIRIRNISCSSELVLHEWKRCVSSSAADFLIFN